MKLALLLALIVGYPAFAQSGKKNKSDPMAIAQEGSLTREAIQKHAPRKLALLMVARFKKIYEKRKSKPNEYWHGAPRTNAQIIIAFHSEDWASISRKGFLNYHQTGSSSIPYHTMGNFTVERAKAARKSTEQTLIGLANIDRPELLPKYGQLHFNEVYDLTTQFANYPPGSRYGTWIAVLKDEVKDRATWSLADSLTLAYNGSAIPGKTVFSMDAFPAKSQQQVLDALDAKAGIYLETQVWGPLTLRDVKEFWVPSDVQSGDLEQLKKAGIPIFKQEYASDQTLIRGEPLFTGCNKIYSEQTESGAK